MNLYILCCSIFLRNYIRFVHNLKIIFQMNKLLRIPHHTLSAVKTFKIIKLYIFCKQHRIHTKSDIRELQSSNISKVITVLQGVIIFCLTVYHPRWMVIPKYSAASIGEDLFPSKFTRCLHFQNTLAKLNYLFCSMLCHTL